jgi:hypothetical protein
MPKKKQPKVKQPKVKQNLAKLLGDYINWHPNVHYLISSKNSIPKIMLIECPLLVF